MWRNIKISRLNETVDELQIRLATKDDAALICQYFAKNRLYLKEWEPKREEAFFTQAGWLNKLVKLNELHLLGLGFYCLILNRTSGEMLGTISFSNLTRFPLYSCAVGYSLDQDAQGHGVMTRALKVACDWMFRTQQMHRITASYMPRNRRSAAVLATNGFEPYGYEKAYLLINGKWEDHQLVSLINENWQESRNGKH